MRRRQFLVLAAAGGATALVDGGPVRALQQPAEQINVGLIGTGSWGMFLLRILMQQGGCRITHLCDVDAVRLERARQEAQKATPGVKVFSDLQKLLEDGGVDAVVIALPTHWQAVAAILAMRMGKHIYLETPIAYTPREVEQIRATSRESGCIAQAGTQLRSMAGLEETRAITRGGELGPLSYVRTWGMLPRRPIIEQGPAEIPAHVDFNLWLGPALLAEFSPQRFHLGWNWFWEYGLGDQGMDALHWLDLSLDIAGLEGRPVLTAESSGDFFWREEGWEAPDTQSTAFTIATDNESLPIICESRSWSPWPEQSGMSMVFEGGIVEVHRQRLLVVSPDGEVRSERDLRESSVNATREHVANFVRSIVTRERPRADVTLHDATTMVHFANAAYRLRRKQPLVVDWERKSIRDAPEAQTLLTRQYREGFSPESF